MGASPSPQYCELYLSSYEYELCKSLMRSNNSIQVVLNSLQFWFRQMDDLRFINNPYVDEIVATLYPKCLNLKETTVPEAEVPNSFSGQTIFLDFDTARRPDGSFVMRRYWKENALPFAPIKFMQYASNRPPMVKENIVLGLTLSSMYHSNSVTTFLIDMRKVVGKLVNNGYPRQRIVRKIKSFAMQRMDMPFMLFKVPQIKWARLFAND